MNSSILSIPEDPLGTLKITLCNINYTMTFLSVRTIMSFHVYSLELESKWISRIYTLMYIFLQWINWHIHFKVRIHNFSDIQIPIQKLIFKKRWLVMNALNSLTTFWIPVVFLSCRVWLYHLFWRIFLIIYKISSF